MNRFITALLATTAAFPVAAHAQSLPTGGTVVAGSADIATPASGQMHIDQASQNAVINWNSFSIGADGSVTIAQPNADAALLNRVTGTTTSQIAGQLSANGRVFLVNPNGILITPTGKVDAAGFVASTLDIDDADFMDGGSYSFTGGASADRVVNGGQIHIASGGYAALLGGSVTNSGLIAAPMGKVALASGTTMTLDFSGDGFLQVALPDDTMPGDLHGMAVMTPYGATQAVRGTVNLAGAGNADLVSGSDGSVILGSSISIGGRNITVGTDLGSDTTDITLKAQNISQLGAITARRYIQQGGSLFLVNPALPGFSASDFRLTDGAQFIRALGGDGTAANPYQITDVYGLQGIATDGAAATSNYVIANDIDASGTAGWNDGAGFAPLILNGTLNGLGHRISGLTINRPTENDVGLIGQFHGTLSNLVVSGSVVGYNNVGGLVGGPAISTSFFDRFVSQIQGSSFAGTVTGNYQVGGLVGWSTYDITRSHASATVTGYSAVGGLVGLGAGRGTISQSYATGAVTGNYAVGGLVGWQYWHIEQSYATGAVTGTYQVGGLVGTDYDPSAIISQSYATGAVTGEQEVGGIAGRYAGQLIQSYASGAVHASGSSTGPTFVGGLFGFNLQYYVPVDSYWDIDSTGQSSGNYGGDAYGGTGLTSAQARDPASYVGWDFTNDWFSQGGMRPIGRWEANAPGADGFIAIDNLHQLQLMAADLGASYRLTRDIDASESAGSDPSGIWSSAGFVPVGTFTGTLDGTGHAINGLTINAPSRASVGLFSATDGASIANLILHNVNIVGNAFVGALAGSFNGGSILSVEVSGSVSGGPYTGGIAGTFSDSQISDSGSSATVVGQKYAGGLFGTVDQSSGSVTLIRDVYASGDVTGQDNVGGLIGDMSGGSLVRATSSGNVDASVTNVGGLIGTVSGLVTLSDLRASGAVTGKRNVGGVVGFMTGGTLDRAVSTGNVSGGYFVGGLVGSYGVSTIIPSALTNSYATGSVDGLQYVGGLVGESRYLTVANSYASGDVSGYYYVGGLAGEVYNGRISTSYASGTVNAINKGTGGALIGAPVNALVTDSYFITGNGADNGYGTGLAYNDFYDIYHYQQNFAGFDWSIWSPPTMDGVANNVGTFGPELYALSNIAAVFVADAQSVYGDNIQLPTSYGYISHGAGIGGIGISTDATAQSSVGAYDLLTGGGYATDGSSYRIIHVPGTYTVTPRSILISLDPVSRVYGDANPDNVAFSVGGMGLVNGDQITGFSSVYFGGDATSDVGTYQYYVRGATGSGLSNYLITYMDSSLTITPRPITITADDQYRLWLTRNPDLTYSVGGMGLVNGDTLSGALTTDAGRFSWWGNYAIDRGTLTASPNYSVTFNPGTMHVLSPGQYVLYLLGKLDDGHGHAGGHGKDRGHDKDHGKAKGHEKDHGHRRH